MKTKIAMLLSSIALICFIGTALAAEWYFSETQTTQVVDYLVTLDSIPSQTMRYAIVSLTGSVTLGGTPQAGITVHIYLNDVDIGTTETQAGGDYSFGYTASEAAGTTLNFKAGIFE